MVNRVTITVTSIDQVSALDRLVSKFAADLASRSDECVFYLSQPGGSVLNRVIETETADTLQRFIAYVSPHISIEGGWLSAP